MTVEWWGINGLPYSRFPAHAIGYIILAAYAAILLFITLRTSPEISRFKPSHWLVLGGLLFAAPILMNVVSLRFPGTAAPPGIPAEPIGPYLSFFGMLPAILAGGLLGNGAAVLVGIAAGVGRAGWQSFHITSIFEMAFAAGIAGWAMRQNYRGFLPRLLRLPPVAAVLAAFIVWLISIFSIAANSATLGLSAIDYLLAQWQSAVLPLMGELLVAGLFGLLAQLALPAQWAPRDAIRPAPYATSLNRKLIFTLLPLGFLSLVTLIAANWSVANSVATRLIVDQMERDAQNIATSIPYFSLTGQSLIIRLARNPILQTGPPDAVNAWLADEIRTVPFFSQISQTTLDGVVLATYPAPPASLTPNEMVAIKLGFPQSLTLSESLTPGAGVTVSFVAPITDANGQLLGALVGHTFVDSNPLLQPAIDQIDNFASTDGQGFILDESDRIIYHTNPDNLLEEWSPAADPAEPLTARQPDGTVYRDRGPGNTRQLVYYLPVSGYPWTVVVARPNEVVQAQANQITLPLIVTLGLISVIVAIIVLIVVGRVARPVQMLASEAGRIARGDLNRPVTISGDDEVGRLGVAFERMRDRLRGRLDELNMLLRTSQHIASAISIDESAMPVLQSALEVLHGDGARLLIAGASGGPMQAFAVGALGGAMQPIDRDLLAVTETEGRLVLENVSRARAVLSVGTLGGKVQALIALPLKQETRFLGTLCVGFSQVHPFTDSEVSFLSALAGQTALAVIKSQLYEASEGGRRQLQAILASSPDAVIVTDRHENIVLLNPAAESALGVTLHAVRGTPISRVVARPELLAAIRNPESGAVPQVRLDDGRTLFASASPILSDDGKPMGQVTVLRDVTYFKQLDELKSDFVATVSHDLRVPLTFMRGYANMLPMVGQLNPKQVEFNDKILKGIEQMSGLVEALLDLNRLESGEELKSDLLKVGELIENAVSTFQNNAANKTIEISMQVPAKLPPVVGDKTLLQQALTNLVDNAIKYTSSGGQVTVVAEQRPNAIVIAVHDTGIGIAPTDQPRLFEKFYRVRQRDTAGIKGSGLGLSIVKSIVEKHGGRVWVESRLGKGSTFYLSLPV